MKEKIRSNKVLNNWHRHGMTLNDKNVLMQRKLPLKVVVLSTRIYLEECRRNNNKKHSPDVVFDSPSILYYS